MVPRRAKAPSPLGRLPRLSTISRVFYLVIAWLPVVYLLWAKKTVGAGGETLSLGRLWERTRETIWIAGGTAAVALLLGALLAPALGRFRLPARRLWLVAVFLPLFIPPYVSAIAAVRMLGAQGWVTRLVVPGAETLPLGPIGVFPSNVGGAGATSGTIQVSPGNQGGRRGPLGTIGPTGQTSRTGQTAWTGQPNQAGPAGQTAAISGAGSSGGTAGAAGGASLRTAPIYTRAGVIGVLVFSFLPLVVFGGWALLGMTDSTIEEWALLHASPGRVLRRVVLPRALPGLVVGAGAAFLLAMTEFGIPETLRSYPVLSVEVYTQMGVFYSPRAGALAGLALVGLALVGAVGLWIVLRVARPNWRSDLESLSLPGVSERTLMSISPARRRGWGLLLILLLAVPLASALGTLVATSLESGGLKSWVTAWVTGHEEMAMSGKLGLMAAVLCLALAVAMTGERMGRGAKRNEDEKNAGKSRVAGFGRALLMLGLAFPLVMPGPVVATGWSRLLSELSGWGSAAGASAPARAVGEIAQWLLDGPGALMLAWVGRWTPVALGLIALGRRQVPREWEEAALLEGAGRGWRFAFVEWPLLRRPIVAAGALIFCLSLGEVGAAVLLLPPGVTTLGVRLMTLMHYAPTAIVSAQSLMTTLVGVAAAAVAFGVWTAGRRLTTS